MKYRKWNIGEADRSAADALRSAGYSGLLASVLAARGVTTPEAAAEKLERERKLTLSPLLMKDMDRAVARIQQAIADGETMAVFGDYDVDGITATVVVEDYLRRQGAECLRYIPRRVEDGYGLSLDAIRRLREKGATLLITVDCGVTGVEEVDYARSLGMDVVVTDHHLAPAELPEAAAVVDPQQPGDESGCGMLSGAGVAFQLVCALEGCDAEELLPVYGDLAAIGTVADIMPLVGENRRIVKAGLALLQETDRPGLAALIRQCGLEGKRLTHWTPAWFHAAIRRVVEADGGDYDKINLVNLDVGDIVATLGNVADATWVYENWENQVLLEAGKEINYFNLGDVDPIFDFCAPAMAASEKVLRDKPDAVRRFLKVLDRAYREVAAHPEKTVMEVRDMLPADATESLLIRSQKHLAPILLDKEGRWGRISDERWNRMADFLVECGVISGRTEREFTNEYFEA